MRILLLTTVLLFSGCSKPCTPEKVYIKQKMPKLKILYPIKSFTIRDYGELNEFYYKVNKAELHKAAEVSQKKTHNIKFYEKQNMKYNEKFHDNRS